MQLEPPPAMTKCRSDPGFVAEAQLIDIGPPTATAESVKNLASMHVVDETNGITESFFPPRITLLLFRRSSASTTGGGHCTTGGP